MLRLYAYFFETDKVGHLVINFPLCATFFTCASVLIVVLLEWDPIQIFLISANFNVHYKTNLFTTIFRFIISLIFSQAVLTTIRTMIIISFTKGASFINLQGILLNQDVRPASIALYRQLIVEQNILINSEKCLIACALAGGFFLIILSLIAIEIGFFLVNIVVILTAAILSIFIATVVIIVLKICCSYQERSLKIKEAWLEEAGYKFNRKYWTMVIKSCKPLVIPAGNVGVVDKEMKINYFHSVLVNTANVRKSLFGEVFIASLQDAFNLSFR